MMCKKNYDNHGRKNVTNKKIPNDELDYLATPNNKSNKTNQRFDQRKPSIFLSTKLNFQIKTTEQV